MLLKSVLPVTVSVPLVSTYLPIKLPPSEKYEALAPAPGQTVAVVPPVLGNTGLRPAASIFILPEDGMFPVMMVLCGNVGFTNDA